MNKNTHVLIPDIFSKNQRPKAVLISIPLTKKGNRNSKAIAHVDKWIPKSVSGIVFQDNIKKPVIKLWVYTNLENNWWENQNKYNQNDYDIQLYDKKTYDNPISWSSYDNLIKEEQNSSENLNTEISHLLPDNVNTIDVIKKISPNKNHSINQYQYDMVFKNNQKGVATKKPYQSWFITIGNNTKLISEGTFEAFLLVISGKLYIELNQLIAQFDKHYYTSDDPTYFKQMSNIEAKIVKLIEYVKRFDKKKAEEYKKQLTSESSDELSLNHILKEIERKKVIRKGKVVKKIQCPDGKKVKGGRCVVIPAKEKMNRKRSAKKAALKRKSTKTKSNLARKRSQRKRKSMGL